ncbi:MAG TPA: TIGR00159 family protein [Planctomycetes bacterium]|nr:TIGR00159 family protein [Planctomycetota bacterium]HIN80963.1 TIGR00159 family protein [Planctomycetota bacterium]
MSDIQGLWNQVFAVGWWLFLIEVILIYLLIYYFIVFCEGTRGAGILKGLALFVLLTVITFRVVVYYFGLERIGFLLTVFTPATITALIVILQPELRRGLVRISQTPIFGEFIRDEREVIAEVIRAVYRLSKNKVGALIAIEREQSLTPYADRGTRIDTEVVSELLTTIFYPGTELHDGAVIIQQGRVSSAGCLFPLSENTELGTWAGTRHRAGVGITEETDAVTVVVSEESGQVSLCVKGRVLRNLDREALTERLRTYYAQKEEEESEAKPPRAEESPQPAGGDSR